MSKIYHAGRVFKQSLLLNLGLPDEATGSLSLWFEENAEVTRILGWNVRLSPYGFESTNKVIIFIARPFMNL